MSAAKTDEPKPEDEFPDGFVEQFLSEWRAEAEGARIKRLSEGD